MKKAQKMKNHLTKKINKIELKKLTKKFPKKNMKIVSNQNLKIEKVDKQTSSEIPK